MARIALLECGYKVQWIAVLGVWLALHLPLYAADGHDTYPSQMDVYLCIGQSNMAGRATLTSTLCDTLENVYLLNDRGEWEEAVNPLNRYSTIRKGITMQRLGPAYEFAIQMARSTNCRVGLVVNARGGSSIHSWLKGGKNGYYEQMLLRVRQALKQGGRLKAVIWHQGEADCAYPQSYAKMLQQFVTDLRTDLGMPCLPVVVGQIARWNWTNRSQGTAPFNRMILHVKRLLPYTDCVSSRGLKPYKDKTDPHFDTKSQILLGKRYARKVLKLLK